MVTIIFDEMSVKPMKDNRSVFEDVDLKLVVVLSRMGNSLSDGLFESIKEIGLHPTEFALLEVLYHKGPMPIQKIADKILITSGNMTYVADKLEKKGLLVRKNHKKDRRVTLLTLTEKGQLVMDEAFPKHHEHIKKLFDSLDMHEKDVLLNLSRKLGLSLSEKSQLK